MEEKSYNHHDHENQANLKKNQADLYGFRDLDLDFSGEDVGEGEDEVEEQEGAGEQAEDGVGDTDIPDRDELKIYYQ